MSEFTLIGGTLAAGLAAGIVLQRSRLCLVSAIRDLLLFRATGMTRAMLVMLLAATVGGSLLNQSPTALVGTVPAWLPTMAGGFLFGCGMLLAGSCAASGFWRLGEGQLSQVWILLGLLGGSWIYVLYPVFDWKTEPQAVNRLVQALVLSGGIAWLLWWERRQPALGEEIAVTSRYGRWRAPWAPEVGAVVLVLTAIVYMALTGTIWRVTKAFLLSDLVPVAFVIGLTIGGFLGAKAGGEFRFRKAGTGASRWFRLAGGLLMGYGARMAAGCSVGVLLSGAVAGTTQATFWIASAFVGALLGVAVLRRYLYH